MSTGIEAWKNLAEIGPLYPFVGTEVLLTIVGVLIWIIWHVLQISSENQHHERFKEAYRKRNGGG